MSDYEVTIGIECHVQLATETKLFSGANNDARDAAPNTTVSPICFGLPGVLPMLNKAAVKLAVRAGIALGSRINNESAFERKHYFYPDLPLGYQITQLEKPIIGAGNVEVPRRDGSEFNVRIHHAHLEADAGKLTHPEGADYSLVDLNRAGTPLIEIVSEPDMHSSADAKAYAQELYLRMVYAGVTHGDLYHGNMRFDVNVSVAKPGSDTLGVRTETKNLNSFRAVEKVVEYEHKRQAELLDKGEAITQETRGWNDAKQKTYSQRSKADAHDYRYFPDADLPPVYVPEAEVVHVREELAGALPQAIRVRLIARGIHARSVATLFTSPFLLDRVSRVEASADDTELKQVIDLLINVLPGVFEKEGLTLVPGDQYLNDPVKLIELIRLVNDGKLNGSGAKELLRSNWKTLQDPEREAASLGLIQSNDETAIAGVVDEVLVDPASAKSIEDFRGGNQKAIGYLVGQVIKRSSGAANPSIAQQLLRKKL